MKRSWTFLGALVALSCAGCSGSDPNSGSEQNALGIPTAGVSGLAGASGAAGGFGTAGTSAASAGTSGGSAGALGGAGFSGSGGSAGAAGIAAAGSGGAGGAAGTGNPTPSGPGCLQGSGDYVAKGPYSVGKMDVTIGSSGPYTLFYPQPLEPSCAHPIVAWGNGTGVTGSGTYAFYNEHAASWGIVVAASHNSNVGDGSFHKAALDYLLAENANPSSMFHGKLGTRAGVSGHSQGGIGANAAASHPNVETIVNVQGAFGGPAPSGKDFLCLTGTADLNPAGCKTAVDGASAPAMLANWQGGDHTGTATLAGYVGGDKGTIQYMRLYSAWFRCFLGDDQGACNLFAGAASCAICSDAGWAEIYSRNF